MPTKPENVAGIAPRPMAQAVPVEPERAVFVRPLPGVNGGQKAAKIWCHQEIGHENCRAGAGSRAGDSPAQRTLDAAEARIRWGMAVSTAFPRLQPC